MMAKPRTFTKFNKGDKVRMTKAAKKFARQNKWMDSHWHKNGRSPKMLDGVGTVRDVRRGKSGDHSGDRLIVDFSGTEVSVYPISLERCTKR